ncbi:MAG: PEP/pyruvate-binding domain-containing protein [Candidatus Krumholzibacteria bacterium]|nr:PEP/pyruvate-binding domain-containing protein [Candidatus Krumholzibacteria bacterium]
MGKRSYNPHRASLSRFDRSFFSGSDRFTFIGSGELGGKAHGLARVKGILESSVGGSFKPGISVNIPTLTVLTTDLFDAFMKQNDLLAKIGRDDADEMIAHRFQQASLPVTLVGDLRALVQQAHAPLAVRSSSMLEDAMFEPFASVYATKMVPNNQPDADARFRALDEAVKFVYASTFFRAARNYMRATHHTTRDEKMAVVIQEVVGDRFGDRFYPHVSGVLRSYNFYPASGSEPEDGVAELALGLGRTIVDDGVSWAFSPPYPRANPPFKSIGDMLKHTQTRFWAINMGKPPAYNPIEETEYLMQYGLEEAGYDGSLRHIASTYNAQDDRITSGIEEEGPRVVDFAPILKDEVLPLADLLRELKKTCEDSLGAMVEIEFAMRLGRRECAPADFGFLQVRPMVVSTEQVEVAREELAGPGVVLASERVLGNGAIETIRDVVYAVPERFDVRRTRSMASDLERINSSLLDERVPYVLIGFGRWGTTDPLGGIPVDFGQISGARVIVEASSPDLQFMLSQGSHFFHNVTSFRILYFSVRHDGPYAIDWDWLAGQPAVAETEYIRHVRCAAPLSIRVDGRRGRGVIVHE